MSNANGDDGTHQFKVGTVVLSKVRPDRCFIVVRQLPELMYELRWKEYPTLLTELEESALVDPANQAVLGRRRRKRVARNIASVVSSATPAADDGATVAVGANTGATTANDEEVETETPIMHSAPVSSKSSNSKNKRSVKSERS
mgnify:CR=1 FL=1